MLAAATPVAAGYGWASAQSWPALPEKGFIVGRSATEKDVLEGNAIFHLGQGGAPAGRPLSIKIPQYAYLIEGMRKMRVIVVQAEEMNNMELFGVRDFAGKEYVTKREDLELLGLKP